MSPERPVLTVVAALFFGPFAPAAVPFIRLDAPLPSSPAPHISFSIPGEGPARLAKSAGGATPASPPTGSFVSFALPKDAPAPWAPLLGNPFLAWSAAAAAPARPGDHATTGAPRITFAVASPPTAPRQPDANVHPGLARARRDPMPARKPLHRHVRLAIPTYHLSPLDRETVAACLVLEAASQGDYGMRGVMAVIRNRAHGHPELFASTVLKPLQFSSFNRYTSGHETLWRVIHRAEQDRMWPVALRIVHDATKRTWHDPTAGATHYTRRGEHAAWTYALARTVTIGRHAFYR